MTRTSDASKEPDHPTTEPPPLRVTKRGVQHNAGDQSLLIVIPRCLKAAPTGGHGGPTNGAAKRDGQLTVSPGKAATLAHEGR